MELVLIEHLIKKYFNDGYSYKDIRKILETYGIFLSYRHLQSVIQDLSLKRKSIHEDLDNIVIFILIELNGSGNWLGYKALWLRLRQLYKLNVYRQTVLDLLRSLDPEEI